MLGWHVSERLISRHPFCFCTCAVALVLIIRLTEYQPIRYVSAKKWRKRVTEYSNREHFWKLMLQ